MEKSAVKSQNATLTGHAAALETKLKIRRQKSESSGLGICRIAAGDRICEEGLPNGGHRSRQIGKSNRCKKGKITFRIFRMLRLARLLETGHFAHKPITKIAVTLDVIYICVPTPFTANKDPDISYITSSAEAIAKELRDGQLIILKSTTFPNTTEGAVQPILRKDGKKVGKDFFLAFQSGTDRSGKSEVDDSKYTHRRWRRNLRLYEACGARE